MRVNLALYSDLRVSEIASLKIQGLNLDKVDDPYLYVKNGKRGKSRDVYLDTEFVKELRKFIS